MSATTPAPTTPVTAATTGPKPVVAPSGSKFDNRLFRSLKLTEIPAFLFENAGWNGFFRFQIFLRRNFSSVSNPNKNYAMRWPLFVLAFLMTPGLIGTYNKNKNTRDALIAAKYGDEFNKMTPIEQDYVKKQTTIVMQSNR